MKISAKKKTQKKVKTVSKPRRRTRFWAKNDKRLFTLEVFITDGPMSKKFCKANPEISRRIEMRGDQALGELHEAIFSAFDREDEHMFEFQVGGKGPMDPKAQRYVFPMALDNGWDDGGNPPKDLTMTTIGSLNLKADDAFGYWFDFGDDWWHQINVASIGEKAPEGKYPRIISRIGKSPRSTQI
ncbi:MAG: plasmid pRiA4b ORF-3 family protein [Proteobacteria bacterium]|nr:plasmid pRiA4b ORF-3 family protein [Pseudomonadota bacterium]